MTPGEWLEALRETLHEHRNDADALHIRRYFRDQFGSFGLKQGTRRALTNEYIKEAKHFSADELSSLLRLLWQQDEREFQHTGMELLHRYRDKPAYNIRTELEHVITHKSWWDTIDFIASHTAGDAFHRRWLSREDIIQWNSSGHLWLVRTSILFQLKYKAATDWSFLQQLILPHTGHMDFFIRKAIGWALREYSKTEPERVIDFVNAHELSGLSKREALKVVNKKG